MVRYDTDNIREQIKKQPSGGKVTMAFLPHDLQLLPLPFTHFITAQGGLHKIQNQPRTEPPTKPNPRNPVITIAENSASDKGTDLGVRIMRTLVRYPLLNPSRKVRTTIGTSVFSHFGP